jgi:hypothetical protein
MAGRDTSSSQCGAALSFHNIDSAIFGRADKSGQFFAPGLIMAA